MVLAGRPDSSQPRGTQGIAWAIGLIIFLKQKSGKIEILFIRGSLPYFYGSPAVKILPRLEPHLCSEHSYFSSGGWCGSRSKKRLSA